MSGAVYKPMPSEMETIICFDESSDTAIVYTHNRKLRRRLSVLCEKFPDQFHLLAQDDYSVRYSIPKACISIRKPFSEEHRQAISRYAKEHHYRPGNSGT